MLQLIPLPYYAQEKSGVFAIDAHLKVNSDFELFLYQIVAILHNLGCVFYVFLDIWGDVSF